MKTDFEILPEVEPPVHTRKCRDKKKILQTVINKLRGKPSWQKKKVNDSPNSQGEVRGMHKGDQGKGVQGITCQFKVFSYTDLQSIRHKLHPCFQKCSLTHQKWLYFINDYSFALDHSPLPHSFVPFPRSSRLLGSPCPSLTLTLHCLHRTPLLSLASHFSGSHVCLFISL